MAFKLNRRKVDVQSRRVRDDVTDGNVNPVESECDVEMRPVIDRLSRVLDAAGEVEVHVGVAIQVDRVLIQRTQEQRRFYDIWISI